MTTSTAKSWIAVLDIHPPETRSRTAGVIQGRQSPIARARRFDIVTFSIRDRITISPELALRLPSRYFQVQAGSLWYKKNRHPAAHVTIRKSHPFR